MTWVHDQIYAAGGKHIPSTWDAFMDQTGVTAIVHIKPDAPERFDGPVPSHFLWMDMAGETQAGMDERFLVALFLMDCTSRGLRVLLHSSMGLQRTRWAYVAFSIFTGRSVKSTLRMAVEPPWLAPYHTDREIWEAFAAACRV